MTPSATARFFSIWCPVGIGRPRLRRVSWSALPAAQLVPSESDIHTGMDMATISDPAIVEKLSRRIDELGTKNARLLLFLSIAMVAVATLKAAKSSSELGWTL